MLSFDITDRAIRIIKGSENNGKIRISSAATLDLEEEIIVNGHVRDVPRLATAINGVLRTNKMPDKEAIVSISTNMTIFKELHIQKAVKEQDFMKSVRAELGAALGIDETYSVSYIVVGDSDQVEGGVKVLATACPYEVVDCYKRVFSMLQISLRSVMVGCNCITKVLLADTKVRSKMPLLAVQIDPNFISLNLYENGQLSFSRFASISAEDYEDSDDYVFMAVNENIFRMLQFQKSKSDGAPIENVVFYGDTREYVRLTNELEKMGIRTSIINVPPQIHGYENLEFSLYANAIGAMFKRNKDERINLLETDTVNNNRIKSDSSYVVLLLGSIAASLLLVGGAWLFLHIKQSGMKKEINTIQEKKSSALAAALDQQLNDLKQKLGATRQYYDGVYDAYNAYSSRPYPTSATYNLIQDTIHATVTDALKDEIEKVDALKDKGREDADWSDFYDIKSIEYSEGVYAVNFQARGNDKEPLQSLPSKLVEKLRALDCVYNVPYAGYSLAETVEENKGSSASAQQFDADGNPIEGTVGSTKTSDTKLTFVYDLQIRVKGDKVTIEEG
ncbi:MAG: pilus assembly protein PilM [Oscillospiraceae bacterium]|nr:pilus assembly protein PilM [Oscillospiraceae bacterium]